MEDNKRKLYDALSEDYDLGSFEQFSADIADETKRRKLYDATIEDYDFGDFDSFSSQLGFGKAVPAQTAPAQAPAEEETVAMDFDDEPNGLKERRAREERERLRRDAAEGQRLFVGRARPETSTFEQAPEETKETIYRAEAEREAEERERLDTVARTEEDVRRYGTGNEDYSFEEAVSAGNEFAEIAPEIAGFDDRYRAFQEKYAPLEEAVRQANEGKRQLTPEEVAQYSEYEKEAKSLAELAKKYDAVLNTAPGKEYRAVSDRMEQIAKGPKTAESAWEYAQEYAKLQRNPVYRASLGENAPSEDEIAAGLLQGQIAYFDEKMKSAKGDEKKELKKAFSEAKEALYANPYYRKYIDGKISEEKENNEIVGEGLAARRTELIAEWTAKNGRAPGAWDAQGFEQWAQGDPEMKRLYAAAHMLDDTIREYRKPTKYDESRGGRNVAKGLGDWASDTDTWSFGIESFAEDIAVVRPVLEKVEKLVGNVSEDDIITNGKIDELEKQLTPGELAVLAAYFEKVGAVAAKGADTSIGYQIGQGIGDMVTLGLEMIATGPAGSVARKATEKGLKKGLIKILGKRAYRKAAQSGAGKVALWAASKIPSDMVETAVRLPFMPSTYKALGEGAVTLDEGYHTRDLSDYAPGELWNQYVEQLTEVSNGFAFPLIGKIVKTPGMQSFFTKMVGEDGMKALRSFIERGDIKLLDDAMIGSFGGEWEEELLGAVIHSVTDDRNALRDFFSAEQQLVLLGTLAPLPVSRGTVGGVRLAVPAASAAYRWNRAQAELERLGIDEGRIARIKEVLDNASAPEGARAIMEALRDAGASRQDAAERAFRNAENQPENDVLYGSVDAIDAAAYGELARYFWAAQQKRAAGLMADVEQDRKVAAKRTELEQAYGGAFYHMMDGEEVVETATMLGPDGTVRNIFVTSDAPNTSGEMAYVGEDGSKGFVRQDEIGRVNADGAFEHTGETQVAPINRYLAGLVMQDSAVETAVGVATDAAEANRSLREQVEALDQVTYNGQTGVISRASSSDDGAVFVPDDGENVVVPWEELAAQNGIAVPEVVTEDEKADIGADAVVQRMAEQQQIADAFRAAYSASPSAAFMDTDEGRVAVIDIIEDTIDPEDGTAQFTVRFQDGTRSVTMRTSVDGVIARLAGQPAPEPEPAQAPAGEGGGQPPVPPVPPQEAKPKIPLDENGQKIYDAPGVSVEDALEDLYTTKGLSEEDVDDYIRERAAAAEKNRNPKRGNMSPEEWGRAKAESNRVADFWKEMKEFADANTAEREKERKEQERRIADMEKYGVDTNTFDLTPQTAEEAVAEYLGNSEKLIDLDDAIRETLGRRRDNRVPRELFRHLGQHGILVKNGGRSLQDVANDIAGHYEGTLAISQDDVRDAIIDMLLGKTKSEMKDTIFDNRLRQALDEKEHGGGVPPADEGGEGGRGGNPPAQPGPSGPSGPTAPANPAPANPGGTPPVEPQGFGAGNKVFTKDARDRAREIMLQKLKGQLNSGIDPEMMAAMIQYCGYYIEAGTRAFIDFARTAIKDIGDAIRPYLKSMYNAVRDYPGMEEYAKEMTPYAEVAGMDVNAIDADGTPAEAPAEEPKQAETKYKEGETVVFWNGTKTARMEGKIVGVKVTDGFGTLYDIESVLQTENPPGSERRFNITPYTYEGVTEGQIVSRTKAAEPAPAPEEKPKDVLGENETKEIRDAVDAIVSGKDKKKRTINDSMPVDYKIAGKDVNSYIRDRYDRFKAPLEKRREELRKELVAYRERVEEQAKKDILARNSHIKEDNPHLPDYVSEEADKRLKNDTKFNELDSQIKAIDNEIGNYQERRYNAVAAVSEIYAKTEVKPEESKENPSESPEKSVTLEGEKEAREKFTDTVANRLVASIASGERPFKSITDLRRAAREAGMEVDDRGATDILIQELTEVAIVRAARKFMSQFNGGLNSRNAFNAICKLYEMQPTISMRSNQRVAMQQYSTPLPMSFVAQMFAYRAGVEDVLEPTAGNGMLVFGIPADKVHANELDEIRKANLDAQGFKEVTQNDATEPFSGKYDAVVANPPFGSHDAVVFDGKSISGLDPVITLRALDAMEDDGRAAIIIGGNVEWGDNGSWKTKKAFFSYLYDHYNVKGVVNITGDMYARQGTSYPTMMILIDGRRSEDERAKSQVFAPVRDKARRTATTNDELYDIVTEIINDNRKTDGNEVVRSERERKPADGVGQTGSLFPGDDRAEPASDVADEPGGNDGGAVVPGNREVVDAGEDRPGPAVDIRPDRERRGTVPDVPGEEPGELAGQTDDSGREGVSGPVPGGRTGTDGRGGEFAGVGDAGRERPEPVPSGEPAVRKPLRVERKIEDKNLAYVQHSSGRSLESVAPAAMVEAMDAAIQKIEREQGRTIDEFVTEELGYKSTAELHKALAAEQIDSVAMAIYQMKQGRAMIIGDQTGVGKGRQMAALIRWANRQGKKPIFMTQKAGLFSDIYRDLRDIGSGTLKPLILNSADKETDKDTGEKHWKDTAGVMLDENGKLVYRSPESGLDKIIESGNVPDGYDFVVLTYSQLNSGDQQSRSESRKKVKEGTSQKSMAKAAFVRRIADGNYVLLDESHTAAGEGSNSGVFLRSIMPSVAGVTFSSATFAKRPDTMPLYAIKSAMSEANVEPDKLIGMIKKGGVTLQEIMARALTDSGQMVRRERDMSDVKTDWKTVDDPATAKKARANYDRAIEIFNKIIAFQRNFITPVINEISDDLAERMSSARETSGTRNFGVDNPPFVNQTYNFTKQLMLALKAEAIVDEVVKEIKAGRHPVIALENTYESGLSGYDVGDKIEDTSFSGGLTRSFARILQYTVTDPDGNKSQEFLSPEELGDEAARQYYALQEEIKEATKEIFLSPLDLIKQKLSEQGYKVGEVTGRKTQVVKEDDGYYLRQRTGDAKQAVREFNSGESDVIIINKSGSTGISLHASVAFKDQRPRSMIIAQPLGDINDYMQMIGRIDRTGQVHRGYYINLSLPVPAETRFNMMLAAKLKSLNANTTTSQESDTGSVDAPDFLNKYGSQVVIEYLRDHPEVFGKLVDTGMVLGTKQNPVRTSSALEAYRASEEDAQKVTGRIALLPVEEQEAFYTEIAERYNTLIRYLDETGENTLKITTLPLKAKTLARRVGTEGRDPGGNNPFAQNSYVERVEVDVLRKPMKADEIVKVRENLTGGKQFSDYLDSIISRVDEQEKARLDAEDERYAKEKDKVQKEIEKRVAALEAKVKDMDEVTRRAEVSRITGRLTADLEDKHQSNVSGIKTMHRKLREKFQQFNFDQSYLIYEELEGGNLLEDAYSPALFCGFKTAKAGDNVTPSTSVAVFATLDGRRRLEIKFTQESILDEIENFTNRNYFAARETTLSNWDSSISNASREERYILTGNILQAWDDATREGILPGRLVSYTDIDGNIKDGILMNQTWQPDQLHSSGVPINSRVEQILNGESVKSSDGEIEIEHEYGDWFDFYVPKSKKAGAKYWQNEEILSLVYGGGFRQYRGRFYAEVSRANMRPLLNILGNMGVRIQSEEGANDWEETGKDAGRPQDEEGTYFRQLTDPDKIAELEAEEKVPVYRSALFVPDPNGNVEFDLLDGKGKQRGFLYPPMSVKVDGKFRDPLVPGTYDEAEERPDLATDDGHFTLVDDNGDKMDVLYAPYLHNRVTPLNEQFSAAYRRNLVVIRSEVPISELTSKYTAEKSKKSTGKHDWPSGTVSNALAKEGKDTRKVILSRWAKIGEPVPYDQVADEIVDLIGDRDLAFEYNVVSPGLRKELQKRGVRFEGWHGKKPKNYDSIMAGMQESVNRRGENLRNPVDRARAIATIDGIAKKLGVEFEQDSSLKAKGAFNPKTGKIRINIDAHRDTADLEATLLHEAVAHYGLRKLFGNDWKALRTRLYEQASPEIKARVDAIAKADGLSTEVAMEEYIASLAEDGRFDQQEESFWQKVVTALKRLLAKIGINAGYLTDEDFRAMLYASYRNLQTGGALETAARIGVYQALRRNADASHEDNGPEDDGPDNGPDGGVPSDEDMLNNSPYAAPFYSNAQAALSHIKMDKATPEQWVKMLEKEGGLKAGEDKWLGLSDWLKGLDRKTVTKQEIADFIEQNRIQVEEARYGELIELPESFVKKHPKFEEAFYIDSDMMSETPYVDSINNLDAAVEMYNEAHEDKITIDDDGSVSDLDHEKLMRYGAELLDEVTASSINSMRLKYTTADLDNKREIALTVPTIEPWNESDKVHFGDAGKGRAVAWARFGDTTGAMLGSVPQERFHEYQYKRRNIERKISRSQEALNRGVTGLRRQDELGLLEIARKELADLEKEYSDVASTKMGRVLVIDEIQSKRHQEGRAQGYKDDSVEAAYEEAGREQDEFIDQLMQKYGVDEDGLESVVSPEEFEKARELDEKVKKIRKQRGKIPAAPFERNWHELAMKRMLRLAAEEGYDYVAWTTGEQQAERYSIGKVVDYMQSDPWRKPYDASYGDRVRDVRVGVKNSGIIILTVNENGDIVNDSANGQYKGNKLSEVVGKELSVMILQSDDNEIIKGDGLRIGGEGMRGFYDDILPRFMNKYGKKWGVKVQDIFLPEVEESARTMHAVPVTSEMAESVLQGQPMFRKAEPSELPEEMQGDAIEQEEDELYRRNRNTVVSATAADVYNTGARSVGQALREVVVDEYASVDTLMDAIAKESGRSIRDGERVTDHLREVGGKAMYEIKRFSQRFLKPMWDAVAQMREAAGLSHEELVRYVGLKSGLERNIVFAKRDAKRDYQAAYDAEMDAIKAEEKQRKAELDRQLRDGDISDVTYAGEIVTLGQEMQQKRDDAAAKRDGHFADVDAGTDSRYAEYRKKDYSALMSWFIEKPDILREDYPSDEAYNRALAQEQSYAPGITDLESAEREAQAIIDGIENNPATEPRMLWDAIRKATTETLDFQYRHDMITRQQRNDIAAMMKYYVPMRGFADETAEDLYSYYMKPNAAGFAPTILAAKGRTTAFDDPFGMIGFMHSSAVSQGLKNQAKLSLLNLVRNRKGNSIATVTRAWFVKTGEQDVDGKDIYEVRYPQIPDGATFDERQSIIDQFEEDMAQLKADGDAYNAHREVQMNGGVVAFEREAHKSEHIVPVREGGKEYGIILNGHPAAAQAINGMKRTPSRWDDILTGLRATTRFLSSMFTTYSIPFWVSNFQRDHGQGLTNAFIRNDTGYVGKYILNRIKVGARFIGAIMRHGSLDALADPSVTGQLADYYRQYVENGGPMGQNRIDDNEYFEKQMERYLRMQAYDKAYIARGAGAVITFLGSIGEAVETMTRFATFVTSMEEGRSLHESISDAKEISTNFARKGSGRRLSSEEIDRLHHADGSPLNWTEKRFVSVVTMATEFFRASIPFFNAAVQGLENKGVNYRDNFGKTLLADTLYLCIGFGMRMLFGNSGGDDDKEKYSHTSDYLRRNNILMGLGDGKYHKWALPQEYRVCYALGDILGDLAFGRRPVSDLSGDVFASLMQLSPVGAVTDEVGFIHGILPGIVTPLYEGAKNKTFTGARLYNEGFNGNLEAYPGWVKALPTTGQDYVKMTKWLTSATGGDDVQRGWLEKGLAKVHLEMFMNPAVIEHLVESYLSGPYQIVGGAVKAVENAVSGETTIRDIPILSRVLLDTHDNQRDAYYSNLYYHFKALDKEAQRIHSEYKTRRRSGDSNVEDFYASDDYQYMLVFKAHEKKDRILRKMEKIANENGDKEGARKSRLNQEEMRREIVEECLRIYFKERPEKDEVK